MSDPVLRAARADLSRGSRSFAMAARLLPPQVRDDVTLLYAWCRHCDDAIDGQTLGGSGRTVGDPPGALAALRAQTSDALARRDALPAFVGLARVCARHGIPSRHPDALLDGFAMDVAGRRFATLEDTLDYSYHAAGVVGVMMAMVMGVRRPAALDRASDLGLAFQLTNIARDVVEDARMGRCYVPESILKRRGLAAADLTDPRTWPRAHLAACDLLDVAERYYASSLTGLADLPRRSVWGIAAARRIYREIGVGVRLTEPGVWAKRVVTPNSRKIVLAVQALRDGPRAARIAPVPRDQLWSRPDDMVS